jgi:outer membrane protein OmpA-like peptidoglycan-associated protein
MKKIVLSLVLILIIGCSASQPIPDRMGDGVVMGMLTGAGTGAVTGVHIGSGMGPGAFVGAGFGILAGAARGYFQDWYEDELVQLHARIKTEQEVAYAHLILTEHYQRRIKYHPARDIYPADWFFFGDEATLRPEAKALVREIARINKKRFPWSRLVIANYVKSVGIDSNYAEHLATRRARELGNYFVRYGIEPRRIETRGITLDVPILVVPDEEPKRYSQALELILEDR